MHEKLHTAVKKAVRMVKEQSHKEESKRLALQSVIAYEADRMVNKKTKREQAERNVKHGHEGGSSCDKGSGIQGGSQAIYSRVSTQGRGSSHCLQRRKLKKEVQAERLDKHQVDMEESVRVTKEQTYKEGAKRFVKESALKAEAHHIAKEKAEKETSTGRAIGQSNIKWTWKNQCVWRRSRHTRREPSDLSKSQHSRQRLITLQRRKLKKKYRPSDWAKQHQVDVEESVRVVKEQAYKKEEVK